MERSIRDWFCALAWSSALFVGCTGNVQGDFGTGELPAGANHAGGGTPSAGSGGSSSAAPARPTGATPAAPPACRAVGPAPLRRLTALEYTNTVRALFGTAATFATAPDAEEGPFRLNTSAKVAGEDVRAFMSAAEAIAAEAATHLDRVVPCSPTEGRPCADKFIKELGARAFRRPLSSEEVAGLHEVFAAGGDFTGGVRLVVEALLQSPHFLYLVEGPAEGPAATTVALGHYEIASRLSYFFWRSIPDQTLFQAAAQNGLGTPAQIEAQAVRMMRDPKFTATVVAFYEELLGFHGGESVPDFDSVTKDARVIQSWTDALKASMKGEILALVTDAYTNGRSFEWLLAGGTSHVDAALAKFYGLAAPRSAGLQPTALPASSQRAGLLTTAGLLALYGHEVQSAPVQRGVLLRDRILCLGEPPPPPADADASPVAVDPRLTGREQIEQRTSAAACAGCHALINPFGFLFENYDGAGRFRETDAGKPVNARSSLPGADITGEIDGAVALSRKLGASTQARACLAEQWVHFGLGRAHASTTEACSMAQVMAEFRAGNESLSGLLVGIVKSDAFRFRAAP